MFIHQAFRDDLKRIRPDLQVKFGLQNVDAMPDDVLLAKVLVPFASNVYLIQQRKIVSDSGSDCYINQILTDLKSIDDTYMWTTTGLFRRDGLVDLINTIEEELNEAELFKIGKVVRVCAGEKLRTLNLSQLRDYTGRHYKVLTYVRDEVTLETNELINAVYATGRYRKVYVEDGFGNKYCFPQCAFVPTSIKDLRRYEEDKQLEKILYRLQDSAKYDLEQLSEVYASKLRDFMESSKRLQQKMTLDFTEGAKIILDMQLNLKDKLKKNIQVASVAYVIGKQLTFETVPLRCSNPDDPAKAKYPIGRYKCTVNLVNRDLKAFNIDIGERGTYQHPHIQGSGICCLGARVNPLRESYSKQDWVTLVGGIIAYLEHLNPSSVYRSMADRQGSHGKRFQYQVDQTVKSESPEITTEEPATLNGISPDLIVVDEARNADGMVIDNHVARTDINGNLEWVPLTMDDDTITATQIATQSLETAIAEHLAAQDVATF